MLVVASMIAMRMTKLYVAGQGNRHYIRLLLCHAKGATCFDDLKFFEGHAYDTYKEACAARGLLDDDKMHDEILGDAILHQMPRQLRHTFAILLFWDEPTDPRALWDKYKLHMAEDFLHRERQVSGADATVVIYIYNYIHTIHYNAALYLMCIMHYQYMFPCYQKAYIQLKYFNMVLQARHDPSLPLTDAMTSKALLEIEDHLQRQNKSLTNYGMLVPDDVSPASQYPTRMEAAEHDYDVQQLARQVEVGVAKLRPAQRLVWDKVNDALNHAERHTVC